MKILAIIGTNRRKGTICSLTDALLDGAAGKGNAVEKINLYDHKIEYCRACWSCARTGTCLIQDDVAAIIAKLAESDVIILGIPCYWANVPGIVKSFFDRHSGYAMKKPRDAEMFRSLSKREKISKLLELSRDFGPMAEFRNKKFIIISALTTPFPLSYFYGDLPGMMNAVKTYVKNMKGRITGKIIYSDSLFRILSKKDEKYLKKAYLIGYNL